MTKKDFFRALKELGRFFVAIVTAAVIIAVAAIASADEVRFYLISGEDRQIIRVYDPDVPGESRAVYVDCSKKKNPDPVGCFIATSMIKNRQLTSKRK